MSLNTRLDDQKVLQAEGIITYQSNDHILFRQALRVAGSMAQDGNKSLAMLGDAAIKLVLINEGRRRHATRGEINTVVSEIASNAFLAQRGFATRLGECVYNNPSQGNTVFPGPMASTVEAIIGAIFIDSGEDFNAIKEVMETLGISWPK